MNNYLYIFVSSMYVNTLKKNNCFSFEQTGNASTHWVDQCSFVSCRGQYSAHTDVSCSHLSMKVSLFSKKEVGCPWVFLAFFPAVCTALHSHLHIFFSPLSPPLNSIHPTTRLSSPFRVVHLYGNNWFTLPLAVFKAHFHHLFWRFFLCFLSRAPAPIQGFFFQM